MNVAAGEGIEEEMPALARFHRLREKVYGRRQCGPLALYLDERARGGKLRLLVVIVSDPHEGVEHGVGERGRERHSAALPARRRSAATCSADKGDLVSQSHEFQRAAGEPEVIARLHARDEALFHGAKFCAPWCGPVLHHDGGVAHDRADVQFVAQHHVPIGRAPDAFRVGRDTAEAGVGREARVAASYEIEHPRPILV